MRVHLFEMIPDQRLQALARETIHVGFTRPLPRAQAGGFVQERVYRDRLFAVLPQAHPLAAGGREVPRKKLAGEDFVLYRRDQAPELADRMTRLCIQAGFSPRVVSEPPMMQTVLLAVAAGVGVSLMPGCVRHFPQPGAVFRLVRPASPPVDLVLVRPKRESRRRPWRPGWSWWARAGRRSPGGWGWTQRRLGCGHPAPRPAPTRRRRYRPARANDEGCFRGLAVRRAAPMEPLAPARNTRTLLGGLVW